MFVNSFYPTLIDAIDDEDRNILAKKVNERISFSHEEDSWVQLMFFQRFFLLLTRCVVFKNNNPVSNVCIYLLVLLCVATTVPSCAWNDEE